MLNINQIEDIKQIKNEIIQDELNPDLIGGQYSPYVNQRYGYRPSRINYITKKPEDRDTSKIAYTITIDMEVHPGTSLTPEQISESKCNNKYNAIRKAFSEFTGKPYVIPPLYIKNTQKNKETIRGGTRKIRKNIK